MTDGISILAIRKTVNEELVEISTNLKCKHEEPEQQLQYGQLAVQQAQLAYQPSYQPVQPVQQAYQMWMLAVHQEQQAWQVWEAWQAWISLVQQAQQT
ncbi:hypothetical protein IW148_005239 [Coemansia sp. RSA 1199]|nr:hypothetical protein IW148_005239 [Coemansia sp. RSA 1199]